MSAANFEHTSVLLHEVVEHIAATDPGLIVDCTLGGAGHASALLDACPNAHLIGLDRDPTALSAARQTLKRFGDRVTTVHARFSEVSEVCSSVLNESAAGKVDALLVDLGVSSPQLDVAERGFSFRLDGPLDMRMDPSEGESVADLLDHVDPYELMSAIRNFGEERYARRVANAILEAHKESPLTTTSALAEVVRRVVPKAKERIDPATRTFQGLRMWVNQELDELKTWLNDAPELLSPGGVVAAISFHSLEDRAVKRALRQAATGCVCPPQLPVCACGLEPLLTVITRRPLIASDEERSRNPRARSAKLRIARRLPLPEGAS